MAVEVRYVGTRGVDQWSTLNYNERNLIENGFYDEFLKAMANYQAHRAPVCTTSGANACSFAYRGPGTGTSPLPIYLAYLTAGTECRQRGGLHGHKLDQYGFSYRHDPDQSESGRICG